MLACTLVDVLSASDCVWSTIDKDQSELQRHLVLITKARNTEDGCCLPGPHDSLRGLFAADSLLQGTVYM